MTTQEFSNEFDVLYNNVMSNQAPGLDEYEKSVFLTKAQNEILKDYFNPKGNKMQEGFDGSPKRQIDFSSLIVAVEPDVFNGSFYVKIDERSLLYSMPTDILFVLNETALNTVNGISRLISIIPINYEEYAKALNKPYKQPLKNQGWRLFQSVSSSTTPFIAEIIVKTGSTLSKYKLRYLKRPTPIILTDLEDSYSDVSIDGYTTEMSCALDEILHPEILQRAVELAKAAYQGDIKSVVELGQRGQ